MLRSERALMALRTNGASCSIYRIQGSRARALQRARSSVHGIHHPDTPRHSGFGEEDAWRIESLPIHASCGSQYNQITLTSLASRRRPNRLEQSFSCVLFAKAQDC